MNIPYSEIPTRRTQIDNLTAELRRRYFDEEIASAAAEVLARADAGKRHEWRVRAARIAARNWLDDNLSTSEPYELDLLCAAEVGGLFGGGYRYPGASTLRHPAFRGLGSGRRLANDGDAWTAAIAEVCPQDLRARWVLADQTVWLEVSRPWGKTVPWYLSELRKLFPASMLRVLALQSVVNPNLPQDERLAAALVVAWEEQAERAAAKSAASADGEVVATAA